MKKSVKRNKHVHSAGKVALLSHSPHVSTPNKTLIGE